MTPTFGAAKLDGMGWVYILECSDESLYVGSTRHIRPRQIQHRLGLGANHTRKHRPFKLVYLERYSTITEAFDREKQLQGWRREKKLALITGCHEKLKQLAKAYFLKTYL